MAHDAQREFLAAIHINHPDLFEGVSVIEVGSLDINGSVRDFFTDPARYVGVDVGEGPGVDLVVKGGEPLPFPTGSFDVAISAECFEHNPFWLASFVDMCRLATKAVLFTCATTGRPEHGTPQTDDYSSPLTVALGWGFYRNLVAEDFSDSVDLDRVFSDWSFHGNTRNMDLYFFGQRHDDAPDPGWFTAALDQAFAAACATW